ncbi:MAG: glycosyltransferase family 2 protein [Acidobacteria bacterium]|nr:glycosyltransferase family 2 protein [Acidobacteriota bacterium]
MQSATGLRPPLVSVIVPSYNYGHLIAETLSCVESQTYENWECLVVDDGSTDDTAEVVSSFSTRDARIRYLRQDNQKQAAARNLGVENSHGEYFQFLDADDLIETRKLGLHAGYLVEHPEIDIVYSGVRYFRSESPNERLLSRRYSMWEDGNSWMPEISGSGNEVLGKLLRNNIMVVNAPLVRRSMIENVGLFNVALPPVEDWEYWIRCAAKGATFHFDEAPESHALVRSHAQSASADGRRMLTATVLLRKEVRKLPLDEEMRALNGQMLAEAEGLLGIEEVINGRLGRGIYQLYKAAVMDQRLRPRAKWLLCAMSAPFVSKDRLQGMVTGSVTGSLAKAVSKRGK